RLSLQRHQQREEHWFITQGEAAVTLDERLLGLQPGAYVKIPCQSWHRLTNPAPADSGRPVELIELQLGAYFGEDDIER
ncbi:phosphomannose isomerase type II C-terminal cupin domain, partial [Salmonella enterica]|uniref:phosphomannose isomerase type II C-terminal cupin domain n=1 Tax=Salmonella enterica TaxID=28901 RepID=UPI003D2E939A